MVALAALTTVLTTCMLTGGFFPLCAAMAALTYATANHLCKVTCDNCVRACNDGFTNNLISRCGFHIVHD